MRIVSTRFFKVRAPKKFRYVPRYYDERKERLKALHEKYAEVNESEMDLDAMRERRAMLMRERISTQWKRNTPDTNENRTRTLRLVMLLGGMLVISYLLLKRYGLWESFFN